MTNGAETIPPQRKHKGDVLSLHEIKTKRWANNKLVGNFICMHKGKQACFVSGLH